MSRRRGRAALPALVLAGVLALPALALAGAAPAVLPPTVPTQVDPSEPDRQAVVFLVDRVSFEELLAVPQIRDLASAGGAALMSPVTVPGDRGAGAYLTLGAGARGGGPEARVRAFDPAEGVDGRAAEDLFRERHPERESPVGPFLLDLPAYARANDGRLIPGLLGEVLGGAGRTVAVYGNADTRAGRNRPAVLVGMNRLGEVPQGSVGVVLFRSAGGTPAARPLAEPHPDEPGGYRTDLDLLSLVALGGRPLSPSASLTRHLTVFDLGDSLRIDEGTVGAPSEGSRARAEATRRAGEFIELMVGRAAAPEVLVMVVTPSPSWAMDAVKDEVTPLILARGDPAELLDAAGPPRALTSDTTRRVGVVSNEDVAPTILGFFGLAPGPEVRGAPIRFADEPAPFELHERHLANRRMTVPVQVGAGLYVTAAGLLGVVALSLGGRAPRRLRRCACWSVLTVPPLAVALLLAGHLPTLSYSTVVPFAVIAAAAATLAWIPLVRLGPLAPPVGVAVVTLAALGVEAGLGWTAALTPFVGGSQLDGARFYGLPNVGVGLLLGAGLWLSWVLGRWAGFALLLALGLFAGLPWIGSNVGGALALFAAAGLWLALRRRGRLDVSGLALAAAVVVVGMAVVAAAHALPGSPPTHGTRFLSGEWSLGRVLEAYVARLLVGLRLIGRNPFAVVPLLGLVAGLVVLLRPPGPFRRGLASRPAWRDALLVTVLASAVAVLANDSGPAAGGLGVATALGGLFWIGLMDEGGEDERVAGRSPDAPPPSGGGVSLSTRPGKMEP